MTRPAPSPRSLTWRDEDGRRHFALEVWVIAMYLLLLVGAIGLAIALS